MALGGIGAVIILLVWGVIATLPKKEDGREGEVRLRSEIKDNFTLKDMLGRTTSRSKTCSGVWKRKWRTGEKTACPVEGITEWMNRRTPFPRKARYSASGN